MRLRDFYGRGLLLTSLVSATLMGAVMVGFATLGASGTPGGLDAFVLVMVIVLFGLVPLGYLFAVAPIFAYGLQRQRLALGLGFALAVISWCAIVFLALLLSSSFGDQWVLGAIGMLGVVIPGLLAAPFWRLFGDPRPSATAPLELFD